MEMTTNALNWFEIPARDFDRARAFYSRIFDFEMPVMPLGGTMMGFLLHEEGKGVGGAIVHGEGCEPATQGTIVYLNGGRDLSAVLSRVEGAGGKVLVGKTLITPEYGWYAHFLDSEGNRVGLHSPE